jgi:hypothetical protein
MKSSEELEQLRGFCLAVIDQVGVSFSEEALEPIRTSRSLRGLREAARDMVEMCVDLEGEQLAALDARLARAGLPTLSLMRDRRYRSLLTVLSRGRIESDDEFRVVSGFASDVEPGHLSPDARAKANALLGAYESDR